ncbi:hypothetical protein DDB_G0283065 [Dictyostelium discoideum AX4]|uniref:Probable serine/threonine-protein kinase DDB_G0283065 n=1 Tax=Dictyostelium discoideum TaxID=44689 RepID=Y0652_DICDI|nr:hypothetical protein DDB_G0283065 [Dictyostelium discoideum AX4]Q54RP7.1 RecName: Full=Probable serine/threonine-protein kinase DDB_G0283065 [Dictyostelium discoideum]EAL65976.1 hypothetical protein DDB_G0283065 [Dictyostelium discoideum AX4]|eukprot:XP_639304.1 hypothetical protein DDB_G0283065 [Dictyostelium discoideum AX4]
MWKFTSSATKRIGNSLSSNNNNGSLLFSLNFNGSNNNNNNESSKPITAANTQNNSTTKSIDNNNNNTNNSNSNNNNNDNIKNNNKFNRASHRSNITLVAINNKDISQMTNLLADSGISVSKISNKKISLASKINTLNKLNSSLLHLNSINNSLTNSNNNNDNNNLIDNNNNDNYNNDSISSSSSSSSLSESSQTLSSASSSASSSSSSTLSSSSSVSSKSLNNNNNNNNSRFNNEFNDVRVLGKGGFGIVFQCCNIFDQMEYAVKRIKVNQKIPTKELMEVRAMARLNHPNIVRYYGSWIEEEIITNNSIDHYGENDNNLFENIDSFPSSSYSSVSAAASSSSLVSNSSNSYSNNKATYISNSSSSSSSSSSCSYSIGNGNLSISECTNDDNNNYNQLKQKKFSLYIQMELCKYSTLRNLINEINNIKSITSIQSTSSIANPIGTNILISLDIKQCREITRQILVALKYIHSQGFVHRDITPDNVFVCQSPFGIKIGDFGLATTIESLTVDSNNNNNNNINNNNNNNKKVGGLGTYLYSSNEQEQGDNYNQKTDLYSVGVIFFEMLSQFKTTMERSTTLSKLKKSLSVLKTNPNLKQKYPNDTDFIDHLIQSFATRPFSNQISTDYDNFPPKNFLIN